MKALLAVAACLFAALSGPATAGPYLPEPDELGSLVVIQDQKWALGGFNTVLVVKLKLKNNGSYPLKDFVVGCIAVAPSGTVVGTPRTTLFQGLRPGQSKVFAGVSVGLVNSQTARVACAILSAAKDD